MNNRGQFSIIAAIFVAVILISSVMLTYSSVRYGGVQEEPQILSAIDETNLALKNVLGFTVGYYGSVLQVTGNSSYARTLANKYLKSGLENVANIRPEWGSSFNAANLSLSNNWFMNASYSKGILAVSYSLTGLGVSGVTYSASCRLDVQISPSPSSSQVCLTVLKDENQALNDLGKQNFKFYRYRYSNLTWEMVSPSSEPVAFTNGTYLVDVPSGINPYSYVIQVADTRGIIVAASSFSHYTSTLVFNSTVVEGGDYVDNDNSTEDALPNQGTHSNFTAQQAGPDSAYDTLTEGAVGTQTSDYYPTGYSALGSTALVSGSLSNLTADDSAYMNFRSYASAYSMNTVNYDSQNSATVSSSSSIQWQHTTGTGNGRILLVTVDIFRSSGTPRTVTSITYDGVALTQAATVLYSTNPQVRSYLFYLVSPSSGTKTISVSFSSSTSAVAGSVSYANVDQTSPLQVSNTNCGSGASQSVSLTASGSYNKILFGHMSSYHSSSSYSVTEGSGQTVRWSQTGSLYKGRCSEESVTSGSVSMSWTTSRTTSWTAIAVVLQPSQVSTEQTCEVEFSGSSNTNSWNRLLYTIDSLSSISSVNMTIQLYNWQTGQYPTSGNGYNNSLLGTTSLLTQQNITVNPTYFRDSLGVWKLKFKAVYSSSSTFDISIGFARYQSATTIYALDLEGQWTSVNLTYLYPHPTLCINTGALDPQSLMVDVWNGGSWHTVSTGLANGWNNVSVSSYITSPNFTVRFRTSSDLEQNNWQIDAVLLRPESDQALFNSLNDAVVTVEVLQNGTMRWLGQNLQNTTEAIPIPPVPVKAIHVNETIRVDETHYVEEEVPFQVEDWASGYTVPLGLTNNATVFGNRQMIVFLLNTHVSKFTIWWDGSDEAVQTSLAYTNTYFENDNTDNGFLTNGVLSLTAVNVWDAIDQATIFKVTSTASTSSSVTKFMRINGENSTYGASPAFVIHHGIVRDIVQQESEWGTTGSGGGAESCPNIYANIVLTLPANATYFTYQLGITFINSAQARNINDLCPIKVISSTTPTLTQTENGTALSDPIVANNAGAFVNYASPSSPGTMHHWSQFTWNAGTKGTGIMFTDANNQKLYTFDPSATAATGSLNVSIALGAIELSPVTKLLGQVSSFPTPNTFDVTWNGAVVTFDGTNPIYKEVGIKTGLWILAELPPTITVNTEN